MLRAMWVGIVTVVLSAGALPAQWSVGVETGAEQVGRFVRSAPARDGGPDGRPTMGWPLALRIEHGGDGVRFGLRATRLEPGLELFNGELSVAVQPAFQVTTLAPEFSWVAARFRHGGRLRAGLAIPLERWAFPGSVDAPRWRAGGSAALAFEWRVSDRIRGSIGAALGTVFRHPLTATELIEEYETTSIWRRAVRVGVSWEVRRKR